MGELCPKNAKVGITVNWFVLYVRAASEERVLERLKKRLNSDAYIPFIPRKVYPYIKKGRVIKKEIKTCFPGYVFIRSSRHVDDSINELLDSIYGISEAYYFLCYGKEKLNMALREDESVHVEQLMNAEFCIDSSIGFMEGDCVKIVSGPLKGIESQIVKINKQKRTAVIEVDMFGGKRQITLMLELVERTSLYDEVLAD